MAAASNFLENKLADHALGVAVYTMPPAIYIGLFTNNPNEDASGTEVSGNGYARQEITFGSASGGVSSNSASVQFPDASGGDWGAITHWAIFDASTAGNMLIYGAFQTSFTVLDGATPPLLPTSGVQITVL